MGSGARLRKLAPEEQEYRDEGCEFDYRRRACGVICQGASTIFPVTAEKNTAGSGIGC